MYKYQILSKIVSPKKSEKKITFIYFLYFRELLYYNGEPNYEKLIETKIKLIRVKHLCLIGC